MNHLVCICFLYYTNKRFYFYYSFSNVIDLIGIIFGFESIGCKSTSYEYM
jgi:hypothetical protein